MTSIYDQYQTVIGLEVHVQLATKSKAFCSDSTTFGAEPNTHISAISLAYPGTLPRLNEQQVEFAVRLGLALGCTIQRQNQFDRKNYFYADLPKGYQITQDAKPICVGGELPIYVNGASKTIRIHHIHMEEDAGKSIHDQDPNYSLIDLNRAGVPLLEIVTEPDLRSAEEVDAFMTAMRQLVRYLEVSDGNMEEGSLRCDVNVSVMPKGSNTYGQRCEIKNLNSMRFARRAIDYERKRQIDLIETGGKVQQSTLNFDPATGVTTPLRSKEDAHDYRYFPDPDLPPLHLTNDFISDIRKQQPALPWELYTEFISMGVPPADAIILTEEKETASFVQAFLQQYASDGKPENAKSVSKLVINKLLPWAKSHNNKLSEFPVSSTGLMAMLDLIKEGKVSHSIAYQRLFPAMLKQPALDPLALAEKLELLQSNDSSFLTELADQLIAEYPDKAAAYQKGKKGLIGFFMGQLMKRSKGQADPQVAKKMLEKRLEER